MAVPLGETISRAAFGGFTTVGVCAGIYVYLFIRSILYAVRPDRPPLPQEGAIGGWWCALYIARPHPPQERAGMGGGRVRRTS